MKLKRGHFIAAALFLMALLGVGFWRFGDGGKESAYTTAPVQKGDITQIVTATGSLSAVITVQVGSQVSGTIEKLDADFNTQVKAGQVIAVLNQDKFKAAADQARANLLAAQANVAKTKVSVEDGKRTLERNKELRKRELISQSELDAAQTAYDAAMGQLDVNKAQVAQAQAALSQAAVDLANTVIRSPVDGIVVSRNVDVGQTVAASLQAPTLFLIANSLSKMQVDSNVSEGDVGNVWVDQEVGFTVDAYPARKFKGTVLQVRNAPIMVQNVVTYDAVVGVDNKDLLLKPGMTANLEFLVSKKSGVLKIPNASLRFRPPSEKTPTPAAARPPADAGGEARGGRRNSGETSRGGARQGREGTIYLLKDQKLAPVKVRFGITDGSYTEVVEGEMKEGEQVVLAMSASAQAAASRPPGRRLFGF